MKPFYQAAKSNRNTAVLGWRLINQRRVIVMWNVIISLIFYYIILPTWQCGLKAGCPKGGERAFANRANERFVE
jgi:hypothetical protein